ncbi:hypothetical protein Ato02nite_030010 [Paractinoplanes toevensis]|uniref:Uncharacterized protein n=1 Tax=Paractinoplanes toevensis TaxID=571911 RepID=A0A919T8S2_9ACTN|nr:hypothetical protein Ato02nite_030010 [Actinoplanes toevensis]
MFFAPVTDACFTSRLAAAPIRLCWLTDRVVAATVAWIATTDPPPTTVNRAPKVRHRRAQRGLRWRRGFLLKIISSWRLHL